MTSTSKANSCLSAATPSNPKWMQARNLVMRFGWNSAAYQILNTEMELWFTSDLEGCVGFVRRCGVRVVAGAPVCAESRIAQTAVAFEEDASREGEQVCYFGAASRLKSVLHSLPSHSFLEIGAQPAWNPANWQSILNSHRSLRAQLHRSKNKGIEVDEYEPALAVGNPELLQCYSEWRSAHAPLALGFLTKAISLENLSDRRLFVAEKNCVPVAFLIATPVPDRNGWLIEQIVRGRSAPNGTSELLIDCAMRAFADSKSEYATLGLAPLSVRAKSTIAKPQLWLRMLFVWTRKHGTRFYNFEGLDSFKAKFKPDVWEPIYAVVNEPRFSARTLYAIASVFTNEPPFRVAYRALTSALRQELRWLLKRRASLK